MLCNGKGLSCSSCFMVQLFLLTISFMFVAAVKRHLDGSGLCWPCGTMQRYDAEKTFLSTNYNTVSFQMLNEDRSFKIFVI